MGYGRRSGRRPMEFASKVSHSHIVNDEAVRSFLKSCVLPKKADEVPVESFSQPHVGPPTNPIEHIFAVDGGYTPVAVDERFPSSTLAFLQFGALSFSVEDLAALDAAPFIHPRDMQKLKQIERLKLVLPTRNISVSGESTLTHSVRRALFDFFSRDPTDDPLISTLDWLVFERFRNVPVNWSLASCPHACGATSIELSHTEPGYKRQCPNCAGEILLTDVFRLHEAIDDELGATGVLGYVTTAIEQLVLAHLVRLVLTTKPQLLERLLFIKDGPLAFFGQTANLHRPMRSLCAHLAQKHRFYIVGLEKSGAFVDHAHEVAERIPRNNFAIMTNEYIYKYVIPAASESGDPYGRTTYYGAKVIFRSAHGDMYVASVPTLEASAAPKAEELQGLAVVLENLAILRCDMYDNALVPIALVNKLVSLADHPSSKILQRFAIESLSAQ